MPIHKSQDGKETPIAELQNNHLINILNKAWNEYQTNGVKVQVPNKEFLRYQFENGEHKISQVFETTYVKDDDTAFFKAWKDYLNEAEKRGLSLWNQQQKRDIKTESSYPFELKYEEYRF